MLVEEEGGGGSVDFASSTIAGVAVVLEVGVEGEGKEGEGAKGDGDRVEVEGD